MSRALGKYISDFQGPILYIHFSIAFDEKRVYIRIGCPTPEFERKLSQWAIPCLLEQVFPRLEQVISNNV